MKSVVKARAGTQAFCIHCVTTHFSQYPFHPRFTNPGNLCYFPAMDSGKNIQVEEALKELFQLRNDIETDLRLIKIDPFSGEFADFPSPAWRPRSPPSTKSAASSASFRTRPRRWRTSSQGRHTVVATPTASGKTLIYNAAALDALQRDPQAKSLYLFPTKALSQDQLAELFDLNKAMGDKLGLYTYDGDTPTSMRQAIRKQAQIVITNPYMLHSGILPHHTKWASLFENLTYVVIDELHYYTGVFGSHVANVIRRLKRVCAFYGAKPVFIMSSATIANPADLAVAADRGGGGAGRPQRRPARGEIPGLLQPAGGEQAAGHPPLLRLHDPRDRRHPDPPRPAGDHLRQLAADHRDPGQVPEERLREDRAGPRHGARLPRRLPAQAAARDREGAARRQDQGGGLDQRPGAGHRHRLARRRRARLLPGLDLLDLAAPRPRRPAQPPVAGRAGRLLAAHRPVHRQPPRVFLRPVARGGAHQRRQPDPAHRPRQVRRLRAAVRQGRPLRRREPGGGPGLPGRARGAAGQGRQVVLDRGGLPGRRRQPEPRHLRQLRGGGPHRRSSG